MLKYYLLKSLGSEYLLFIQLQCRNIVLRFDGQLILPYMTPEQLSMEDEDIIDVFVTKPSETIKRAREDDDVYADQSKRVTEASMH